MEQSASVVGNRFVLKYYTALNQKPASVYQFYKANSAFTFGLEDESTTTPEDNVIGSENIRKKIDSLDFHDCKVTLAVVDCQDSLNGGVLVTVIGYLSNKGETPRKFVQTFFLAVQTEPIGYFVLNSVFRYLKDPTVFPQPNIKTPAVQQSLQQLQQVAEVQPTPKETEKPAPTPAPQPTPSPAPAPTPAPVKETKVEQPKAEPKVEANHKPEPKKPEPAPVQTPAPTQEAPKTQKPAPKSNEKSEAPAQQNHKEQKSKGKEKEKEKEQPAEKKAPQPGTWAAMISNNQEKAPKPTSQPKVTSPQPAAKAASPAPAKPAEKEVKEKPAEKEVKEKEAHHAEKPHKEQKSHPGFTPLKEELTVFVSNVPFQATEEQVRACFSKAGEIKSVVLRASSGYSFVEFGNEEVLHKALQLHKAGPFVMEGRQLSLEEKKPNWDKIEKKEYKKDYGFKKDKKPFKKDGANGKTDKPKKDKPFLKEGITAPSQ